MSYEYYGEMRPYSHQLQSIKFMLMNKRGYLFLSPGTGKTSTTLWFTDMLIEKGHIRKVLIIGPLSTLRSVWADEIKKVCPYRDYAIVHGTRQDRLKALKSKSSYYITNTDAVRNFELELTGLRPDVIIIDEVTTFANHSSQRSKAMQRISQRAKCVYGLTGSPVAGGLINSYGIAKVVRPEGLPNKYFTRYRDLIQYQINQYEYIDRPDALKIVHRTLSPAIKFTLEECVDLPEISYETRVVELPKDTMKLFKEMVDHQVAEYKEGLITAQTASIKSIRLIQILTGFTKTDEGEIIRTNINPKLEELFALYQEAGNKLVVFAQSVETTKILKEFFQKKNTHVDLIYGDVSLRERDRIVNHFQSSDEGVLIAQVKTMSHGITLTKSHTLVFFGPVSGNETYMQAIRRIRRIGQQYKQVIIKLISTKFEETLFKKLDQKEKVSQAMLEMYNSGRSNFL